MRWGDVGASDRLLDSDAHHAALAAESARLLDFFGSAEGVARFAWRRADASTDLSRPLELYSVARLVHCFGVAHLRGHPRAGEWAEDGTRLLLDGFGDSESRGFAHSIGADGTTMAEERTTYGHAFALLAGVTGQQAGIAGSDAVVHRASEVIDEMLWCDDLGVAIDAVDRNGRVLESYRGQNANMHLTEAFLAAYEFDGEQVWLRRAQCIARRLVLQTARDHDARIPEHYSADWAVDADYGRSTPLDKFRPFGTMPGHAVEWARLLLNIGAYGDDAVFLECAKDLFAGAIRDGRINGVAGLAYTVDFDGRTVSDARMHWVVAEALSASAWLSRTTGDAVYADRYAEFWDDIGLHFSDVQGGSWWHELDAHNVPAATTWDGKPDLYHAYQAMFTARLTRPCGVAAAARHGSIRPLATTDLNTHTTTTTER